MSEDKVSPPAEMPDKWKDKDVPSLIKKGYYPRTKTIQEKQYLSIRKGRNEVSLGRNTPENWELINTMYQNIPQETISPPPTKIVRHKSVPPLLTAKLTKPESLKTSLTLSTSTLQYYEYMVTKGFEGKLGPFLDDIVESYFKKNGIELVVMVKK